MGQQTSRKTNDLYLHRKIPSLLCITSQESRQKPQEPIKFHYHLSKKNTERRKGTFDTFGFGTINSLKNVLGDVKNKCNGIKNCTESTLENQNNTHDTYHKENVHCIKNLQRTSDDSRIEGKKDSRCKENVFTDLEVRSKKLRNPIKIQKIPSRTKSVPNLRSERGQERILQKRTERKILQQGAKIQQFGYEIDDVDTFLAKATLRKPANIPVVLAFPSVLYQTRVGGYQAEVSLPLGMVVNAIFKNQNWLYVQTPHAEEGYVIYSACLPLGIIPPADDDQLSPCWEKSTDIFPKPSGNMTDTEKLSCHSDDGEEMYCSRTRYRTALSTCGEKSVDRLYLRAAAIAKGKGIRHTLLVINEDYKAIGKDCLSVSKNEVVVLLNATIKGWFYVKNKEGREGFIPSIIAGHGFL